MSIYSALNVGVNGINAQATKIGSISDNIANANTVGYKVADTNFKSLLNYDPSMFDGSAEVYSPSGAIANTRTLVGGQGVLNPSTSATDIGVSGNGLFVVKGATTAANTSDTLRYTRAGAFLPDQNGNFKNDAGYFLQGWRLDTNGDLPLGLNNSSLDSSTAFASLETVNVAQISNTPHATTSVAISANLNATQIAIDPTTYNAADITKNMAEGNIPPQFTKNFDIVDSTGKAHGFTMGFVKTGINTWATEVYDQSLSDLAGTPTTKQVTAGTVTFNGDGTLASVSPGLTDPVTINFNTTGAAPAVVTFNYGTAGAMFGTPGATVIGRTDGLSQFSATYELRSLTQDGTAAGSLTDVSIDTEGYVSATYNNNTSVRVFKIPLALFRDPSQLSSFSGNIYAQNGDSGSPVFNGANQSSQGLIRSNTLEQSTVELEKELTNLIIAQRAYQANTNTVTTTDGMLQSLTSMGSNH